ncbi:hypothetical protein D3C73_1484320 [compost metagenome]
MDFKSLFNKMTFADWIAMCVASPSEMPTSAAVRAGASLIPSPIIAVSAVFFRSDRTVNFSLGDFSQ